MIKSMTGFGACTTDTDRCTVTVEVKTVNSKFLDLSMRLPKAFQDKETEVKQLITKVLDRGKANLYIDYQTKLEPKVKTQVNKDLLMQYHRQLQEAAAMLGYLDKDLFGMAMGMPDVMQNTQDDDPFAEDVPTLMEALNKALDACDNFRKDEGKTLEAKFREYIGSIRARLEAVKQLDPERVVKFREKLMKQLTDWVAKENVDMNRYEQEVIYYIEKLDIQEEIVRLTTHLDYFDETLNSTESNGKKLGFIAQEIGREINTIGSKANDAGIQKHVVVMKEELEKIKEQSLNIL